MLRLNTRFKSTKRRPLENDTFLPTQSLKLLSSHQFREALELLLQANNYATCINVDLWEFAVDILQFRRLGLSENDIRLLVRMRLVDHALETLPTDKGMRQFKSATCSCFTEQTCFILTPLGVLAAKDSNSSQGEASSANIPRVDSVRCTRSDNALVPEWDAECRVLSWEGKIVKQFKWLAANQELVLNAFQEECWPKRILDPLSPQPSQVMKRRLSDTIKCLNRSQINPLIRFRGDGTGEGVFWEPVH